MRPLSILQTLWTTGSIRCVLAKQLQPSQYAVLLFDGTRLLYTELVEGPKEAGEVAASLCGVFIDRTA
jgi:hypothetical protein